ncbi:MAG: MAPEG family protein [Agarilytica sp.]
MNVNIMLNNTINSGDELYWLVLTVLMTALFWVPYIINRIIENGLITALRTPKPDSPPKAQWANRMMRAHENAVENLVLFAPLVLAVHMLGQSSATTLLACQVYFFARLSHYVVYSAGIPYLRTVAFFIGAVAQFGLAIELLV